VKQEYNLSKRRTNIIDLYIIFNMECGMNHRIHAFVSSTALLPQGSMLFTTPRTWHPHIYEPPRKNSRHFITDILGIHEESEKDKNKKESVTDFGYTCKCEGCYLRTSTCDTKHEIKGKVTYIII
jgi:hypothetical protein